MLCKLINLNIFCPKTPCQISIITEDGVKLCNVKATFCSTFCVRTRCRKIKIFAKHNLQIVCKTIYLSQNCCQNICLSFLFGSTFVQPAQNTFTLFDQNYGLPVASAILNFSS